MTGIIDYGMGNLQSVQNALDMLGEANIITSDPDVLASCDRIILPGVGAFGDCMRNIHAKGLYDVVIRLVSEEKKPLLGICLGMQMLFEDSEEHGHTEGFGFMKGHIRRMEDTSVRIPQIGWNLLEFQKDCALRHRLSGRPYVYYVHSYYAHDCEKDDVIASSSYGRMIIPGLCVHGNVMGAQFHPEKSGEDGLAILKYFTEEFR